MSDRPGDEFFEYDCPIQGIDFDVDPLPVYGSVIHCSACGQIHIATEVLGTAHRFEADGNGGLSLVDITDEWKRPS